MKEIKSSHLIILTLNIIFGVFLLILDTGFLRQYAAIIYFVHYLSFLLIFFKEKDRSAFIFSPSFIAVSYVTLSYAVGAYAFKSGYVHLPKLLEDYRQWKHLNVSMMFAILCNVCVICSYFFAKEKEKGYLNHVEEVVKYKSKNTILISIFYFLMFSVIPLNIGFIGGVGSFNIVPKTITALVIFYYASNWRSRYRFIIYLFVLLVFVAISSNNRRDAMFLLLPILLLENIKNKSFRINIKITFILLLIVFMFSFFMVIMSMNRGGNYKNTSMVKRVSSVAEYVKHETFINYFFSFIEVTYTYYHSNKAIEYIVDEPELMTYGSTITKFLFMFVPKSIMPNKPESAVHHYTYRLSPGFRKIGGSWVINLYSEMFWNYHIAGVFFLFWIIFLIDKFYLFLVERIRAGEGFYFMPLLYAYQMSLFYFRGSGISLALVYIILGTIIYYGLYRILPIFNKRNKRVFGKA